MHFNPYFSQLYSTAKVGIKMHRLYHNQISLSQLHVTYVTVNCIHVSLKSSFNTRYFISNIKINSQEAQTDFGV